MENLYDVNPEVYKSKNIYILGTERLSCVVFIRMCSLKIKISGFIDDLYEGPRFMCKPVFHKNQVDYKNSVIVSSCYWFENKKEVEGIPLFVLNSNINKENVYLYGAGKVGKWVLEYLACEKVRLSGVIDTVKYKDNFVFGGHLVYGPEVLSQCDSDASIIICGKYISEIEEIVNRQNPDLKTFGLERMPADQDIQLSNGKILPTRSIVGLFKDFPNRPYVLYGNDKEEAIEYAEILGMIVSNPIYRIDSGVVNDKVLTDIADVLYLENPLVILYGEEVDEYLATILNLGLEEVKDFVHIDDAYLFCQIQKRRQLLDINLGCTFQMNCEYPGLYRYGENNADDKKIAVLGGSTTDADNSLIKSWVEIFYEEYCKDKNITIYNGGIGGYTSTQELIKLMRDIVPLKPDVVLVYDGCNDVCTRNRENYDFGYQHYLFSLLAEKELSYVGHIVKKRKGELWAGVHSLQPYMEKWLYNIRYMHAVCNINGIKFFSFAQPVLPIKKHKIGDEIWIQKYHSIFDNSLIDASIEYHKFIKTNLGEYDYMHDLTGIFDEVEVFLDWCHVYENGNAIIAQNIWDIVCESI